MKMRLLHTCAALLALTLCLPACGSDSSPSGTPPPGSGGTVDTGAGDEDDAAGSQAKLDEGASADLAATDPGPVSTDPGAAAADPGTAAVDPGPAGTDEGPAAVDEGPASTDPGQADRATWETGVGDLFSSNCAGCHGFAGSYAGVSAKITKIRAKINGGHKVSGADKEAMLNWIDDGYPEN
jgi:hypothetical protein